MSEEKIKLYRKWLKKATWTLGETTLLMMELDPDQQSYTFNPNGEEAIHRVHSWLLNKEGKSKLTKIAEKNTEPAFRPGSLLRALKDSEYEIPARLYQVWCQHPKIPPIQMAEIIASPSAHFTSIYIESRGKSTIRGYIKGMNDLKGGRPKNSNPTDYPIDWGSVQSGMIKWNDDQ